MINMKLSDDELLTNAAHASVHLEDYGWINILDKLVELTGAAFCRMLTNLSFPFRSLRISLSSRSDSIWMFGLPCSHFRNDGLFITLGSRSCPWALIFGIAFIAQKVVIAALWVCGLAALTRSPAFALWY